MLPDLKSKIIFKVIISLAKIIKIPTIYITLLSKLIIHLKVNFKTIKLLR